MTIEQRVEQLEALVFQSQPQTTASSGFPQSDILPSDLTISVTPGPDGAFIILTFANWQPTVKGYEIWLERETGGSLELVKTVQYSPATLTIRTDVEKAMAFRVRPIPGTEEEVSLDICPTIAAVIPVPVVSAVDIADDSIQDRHLDHLSANRIVIVDADILSLTANKLTAGTINAAIITVTNIDADNINTGTLDAGVVSVVNLVADNIVSGTLSAIDIVASTYYLQVGNEIVELNATAGFHQENSVTQLTTNIYNGKVTCGYGNSEVVYLAGNAAAETILGQTNAGYLSVHNSLESTKIELFVQTLVDCGRINIKDAGGADTILLYGGSGSTANITLNDSTSATRLVLKATASTGAIEINGSQVLTSRQAAVTAPAGGATVDAEARTAINTIISRLQTHGLIS